jgi:hypothetical protein
MTYRSNIFLKSIALLGIMCGLSICSNSIFNSTILIGTASAQQNDQSEQYPQEEFVVSPKPPWNDISNLPGSDKGTKESSLISQILLYIPNRVIDFLDIFKIDLGVGPALGAVARVSKYGQVGVRTMLPASLRVGLMGRRAPIMLETDGELAIGSSSTDRNVCAAEVGAGVDLALISAYVGTCPDEFADFLAGIFMYDLKEDDF